LYDRRTPCGSAGWLAFRVASLAGDEAFSRSTAPHTADRRLASSTIIIVAVVVVVAASAAAGNIA